ncbi:hypothetical protein [Kibdelosporangium philippinense]|uniref:hypothetical protein n=1 Tax=Kibdelosporangium philippinense TaxID=211113 RepID=UPI00361FFEEF
MNTPSRTARATVLAAAIIAPSAPAAERSRTVSDGGRCWSAASCFTPSRARRVTSSTTCTSCWLRGHCSVWRSAGS